jgi:hypothetical protein
LPNVERFCGPGKTRPCQKRRSPSSSPPKKQGNALKISGTALLMIDCQNAEIAIHDRDA